MSHLDIRNSLQNKLVTTLAPFVGSNIAYENKDFKSEGLSSFCKFMFRSPVSDSCGKSIASSDEEIGFIQVSIFVRLNADDYDNFQYAVIAGIKQDFYFGAKVDDVNIHEVTMSGDGRRVDAWYVRDLTINWSSFQSRG